MRDRFRMVGVTLALATVLASAFGAAAGPVASAAGCSVTNATTGARSGSLAAAVSGAAAGHTLRISGTCTGNVTIGKRLNLLGIGRNPTLRGSAGRPLTVTAGPTTLTGLRVTGGVVTSCTSTPGLACGGGILTSRRLILRRTTVDGNTVSGSIGALGGGIHVADGGSLVLDRSVVKGNTAVAATNLGRGGGIDAAGPVTLKRSRVTGNTVTGATGQGGGIATNRKLTILESTVDGNTAAGDGSGEGGGILVEGTPTVTITRTTISRNRAQGTSTGVSFASGGGVAAEDATLQLTNVTISGNTATAAGLAVGGATGGGIQLASGTILASTIVGNVAVSGGGIDALAGDVRIRSTILAGNTATQSAGTGGADCFAIAPLTSQGRNLVGSGDQCAGTFVDGLKGDLVGTNAAPRGALVGPLANNGGPTLTRMPKAGSPAVSGAGRRPCSTATDQRGVRRPQGARCDIGAVERRSKAPF